MEFPDAGQHCSFPECNSLDFLPVQCSHCRNTFCKNHFNPTVHDCSLAPDRQVEAKKMDGTFQCSENGCREASLVQLVCTGCALHFCPAHRHHGCTEAPRLSKSAQAAAVRKEFRKIKEETDKQVQERLKTAKNRTLANKIKLMKVKGSAFGDNSVPVVDRIFFSVAPPILDKEKSSARSLFFSKDWTLGKTIDAAAKRLKVENNNHRPDVPQLLVFTAEGRPLAPTLDVTLSSLLSTGHLVDGDSLILEYDSACPGPELALDPQFLSKYCFTI